MAVDRLHDVSSLGSVERRSHSSNCHTYSEQSWYWEWNSDGSWDRLRYRLHTKLYPWHRRDTDGHSSIGLDFHKLEWL